MMHHTCTDAGGSTETCAACNAPQVLRLALNGVDSPSIQAWALNDRNRPLWLELARLAIVKAGGRDKVDLPRFTAYIVATAIGL